MSMAAEVKRLMNEVEATPGWTVERRKSGHYQIRGPGSVLFHASGTPSDHRALQKMRSDLKRYGWPNGKAQGPATTLASPGASVSETRPAMGKAMLVPRKAHPKHGRKRRSPISSEPISELARSAPK